MMENDKIPNKTISIPALRRLSIYRHYLERIKDSGKEFISGTEIANNLNIIPIQVRKDLEITGVKGKPKIGFPVKILLFKLEELLGWHNNEEGIIVGCGNLGSALLGYKVFNNYGFDILAAFDTDEKKVGTKISNVKVYHLSKLRDFCVRMRIEIGLLTVPAKDAQDVANMMIASGIKAIWNFAPAALTVPKDIIVQQHDMAATLSVLFQRYRQSKNENL